MSKKDLDVVVVTPIHENCYILHDKKDAVVFDPGGDFNLIEKYLVESKLNVKMILNTHGHFDHIGAVKELKDYTGSKFYIHEGDKELVSQGEVSSKYFGFSEFITPTIDIFLNDGDSFEFNGSKIKVIHTPGHTKGGVCFLIEPENILITGDTIFYESIGRTDFPDSNYHDLENSIKNKVYVLDENIIIYPGHGRSSSIKHEKINNPFIRY